MESLGRHRNLSVLLAALLLQALGLAVQVKRKSADTQDTRLIRIWAVGSLAPFERSLVWMRGGVSGIWHNYLYLRGVRAENRDLRAQIEQMRIEQVRLSEDAAQAHRLQALLSFKEQFISKTIAAQVIGSSGSDMSRIVYIDKGSDAGIKRDMAVITANGIVGKVLLAYDSEAQVLLVSDQTSGVGVILEKTRLQGVLRGTSSGEVVIERVMSDETVPIGENVLTSGGDQIFPKGLPVGTVTGVEKGKDLFLNIKVKPAASLSRLEEVLVLTEKQDKPAMAEDKGRIRAADILAARLPSVPEKPAADAKAVGVNSEPKPAGTTTTAKPAGAAITSAGTSPKPKAPAAASAPATTNKTASAAGETSSEPKSPSTAPKTEQKAERASAPAAIPQPPADDNSPH
jgi:rod shape-determining protein MreC